MDRYEDKKVSWQTSSFAGGKFLNTELSSNVITKDSLCKTAMHDMNRYGDAEELDFEDEKEDLNSLTFIDTSPPYVNQAFLSQEMNGILVKGVIGNVLKIDSLNSEVYLKANGNKEEAEKKCNVDEIKEKNRKECNIDEEDAEKTCNTNEIEDGEKEVCGVDEIEEGEATDDDENVDIEDGEIERKFKSSYIQKQACRFYQRGRCTWGNECHYLHFSDKGKYNMFDTPPISKWIYPQTGFINECNFLRPMPQEPPNELESVWDRALVEAKERIKQSKMKKEEGFEEKLYMTVQNDEWEVLPSSIPKRQNCDFSSRYDFNKHPKLNVNEEPKLARKAYGNKTDYDLEWRDPWRRSKTPLHRKKCTSKLLSESSKSSRSRRNSQSSWSSRSCQSPSSIRARNKPLSKRSRSRSYKDLHNRSPSRSSCSDSTSYSCSSSSSGNVHSREKKRKMSSRIRKASLSPGSIILPYKRRSRSKSHSSTLKTGVGEYTQRLTKTNLKSKAKSPVISSKVGPIARYPVFSKVMHTYRSRSPCRISKVAPERNFSKVSRSLTFRSIPLRNSSKPSAKLKSSDADSSNSQSCSEMSISPVSGSSLKKKCKFSDEGSKLERCKRMTLQNDTHRSLRPGETNDPSSSIPTNENRCSGRSAACTTVETKTQQKASKRMSALKMELLKYGRGLKPALKSSPSLSKKPQSLSVDPKVSSFNKSSIQKSTVPVSAFYNSTNSVRDRLSKRDLLIEQLKAVEEAIAKKKKLHS